MNPPLTSPAPAAAPRRSRPRPLQLVALVALAILAALYLRYVRRHSAYMASGSDASGYFNVARLLRDGDLIQTIPRIASLDPPAWDYLTQPPLGFSVDCARGTMVTTYPVGLPLYLLAAAFVGFYVLYLHSGETWWSLRFILPMFPALILGALLVWRRRLARPTVARLTWLPMVLLALALTGEAVATDRLSFAGIKRGDARYLATARWLQANAPANALVLQMQLSGAFTYYPTFTLVRYDMLEPTAWERLQTAAHAAARPIYATLFDFEEAEAFARCPGTRWTRLHTINSVSAWRLDPPPAAVSAP